MIHVQSSSIEIANDWSIATLIEWLARFGKTEQGGVTRLLYDEAWQQAQLALMRQMKVAGLYSYSDHVGNVFGRIEGKTAAEQVILTGSHVDTVVEGGKYDGAYGVLASLLATQRLIEKYGQPEKTIEVVSLCEEEGSRFPLTYWGSKNIVGQYTPSHIESLQDNEQISFATAMELAGYPLEQTKFKKRTDIAHFVEVHIEQGQILENLGKDIGVVSHIVGQQRFTVTIYGQSNHAGTTEMNGRKDAMVSAATFITHITQLAYEKYSPKLRATIGKIQARPNVSNVIAGEVSFTVDIRHHQQHVLEQFVSEMKLLLTKLDEQFQMSHTIERFSADEPVQLDERMQEVTHQLAQQRGLQAIDMLSGAGHDSQVFAKYIPTTLLFVPSKAGISHSPLEYTTTEQLEKGVKLLEDVLYHLAYKGDDVHV